MASRSNFSTSFLPTFLEVEISRPPGGSSPCRTSCARRNRQLLAPLENVQVAEDLGDLEGRSALDLFHVLAVPPVPRLVVDGNGAPPEDVHDALNAFIVNEFTDPHVFLTLVTGTMTVISVSRNFQNKKRNLLPEISLVSTASTSETP